MDTDCCLVPPPLSALPLWLYESIDPPLLLKRLQAVWSHLLQSVNWRWSWLSSKAEAAGGRAEAAGPTRGGICSPGRWMCGARGQPFLDGLPCTQAAWLQTRFLIKPSLSPKRL